MERGARSQQSSRCLNLAMLGLFKYADFVVGALNVALPAGASFALPGLALPLGISFFTFHSISYLVDVHRREVAANRNPLQVAVYIAMFPQLVAGPIIRYHTISRQFSISRIDTQFESGGDLIETGRTGPTVLVIGDSFTRGFWQDYFSLHAGKYIWMHHELCGFAIGVVESYAPDIVILAPAERQMFYFGK
jgi:hypothetical protein